LAGGVLRSWMLKKFFEVNGDAQIYGGLAKNLLLHGRYATSAANGVLHSTLIRLPGYPLYLAACFRVFGMENYFAACCVQIVVDLVACLLVADFARRMCPAAFGVRAFHCTLWLAALCPFTAIYSAEPLTESLTIFALALAMWAALRFRERPRWGSALAFTFAVSYAALLRPDGALVGLALAPAVALRLMLHRGREVRSSGTDSPADSAGAPMRMALVCLLLALAPFAAWTLRNWKVFHVIEPLAPRYATDPGEEANGNLVLDLVTGEDLRDPRQLARRERLAGLEHRGNALVCRRDDRVIERHRAEERQLVARGEVTEAVELLWETPSVRERFEGTGTVSPDDAEALGLVGPAARACGIQRDVRHDFPAGIYRFVHLPVMTAHHGDVNSRAYVRWLEIQQSISFILSQLDGLPANGTRAAAGAMRPESLVVALTEGWRGEICHVAMTDAAGRFSRYKIIDPSFHNWFALALALRDGQISDFPLCNKSFNLSYCGHDL